MAYCAIDFGTSNSALSLPDGNSARLVALEDDATSIPSAIFFATEEPREVFYGRAAVREYLDGTPGRLMRSLKSILGSSLMDESAAIGGVDYKYADIVTAYLRTLRTRAAGAAGRSLDAVVLGRPIRFVDDDAKQDRAAQGTLAECCRAGGAGIPAFFTPAGYGTELAEGKAAREFNGKMHVLENWLRADFALVKAWRGYRFGNLVYTRTARNLQEGIRLGGDPAVVGMLASEFATKVTLLRQTRNLIGSTFMFVVLPMHAALLGIMLFVTEVVRVFGTEITKVQDANLDSELVREAGVSQAITFASPDMGFIGLFVSLMILLLTFANAFAPYAAAGGHRFKLFVYLSGTLLISGIAMLVIPEIVQNLFKSVSESPLTSGQ
jgi:hypothetical protein